MFPAGKLFRFQSRKSIDIFGFDAENVKMERYLTKHIKEDVQKKIALIVGPRQVGKTTLARALDHSIDYYNYDFAPDRKRIVHEEFALDRKYLIFDELHKMKNWKRWLKGRYDTQIYQPTIVTGSARLDTYRKMGDSLAGRFFQFTLFPIDIKELSQFSYGSAQENLVKLMTLSGFPEPFFSGTESFYRRWRTSHFDIILKQDILETERLRRLGELTTLVELMRERIGNPLSFNSLKEDLQTDDKTVKRWLKILEHAFVFFKVLPYHKSLKNVIHKSPKYYFFDVPRVPDAGARFENFIALSLLKEIHYRNECFGDQYSLHYVKKRSQQEIDFLICDNGKPKTFLECKVSDNRPSANFAIFEPLFGKIQKIQIVQNIKRPYITKDNIHVVRAADYLQSLTL